MSSTYLTSDDMTLIERLLREIREEGPERNFDRETAAAWFLIQEIEKGSTGEIVLREKLAMHVDLHNALDLDE